MGWHFAAELARYGPVSPGTTVPGLAASRAYCARVARSHYENFVVASVLLPRKLVPHFHAVYAYCRWSDDLADETAGGQATLDLLAWWRGELLRCYGGMLCRGLSWRSSDTPSPGSMHRIRSDLSPARGGEVVAPLATPSMDVWRSREAPHLSPAGGGEVAVDGEAIAAGEGAFAGMRQSDGGTPRHPVMVALADTVRRFAIPPQPFLDLLTAFEQDQRVTRYDTFDQLLGYCRNSANPVGRLVLHLFGCHDEERGRLADEVCTGLQLANFWQDVARDFDKGRVYLPGDDLLRFGVGESDLAAKRFTPAFAEMMRFQVERTRGFFERGTALLPLVPRRVRIDVDLFIRGGEAVLTAIERQRYDVLTRRPTVSKAKQLLLLGRAVLATITG